ncbi:MAG: K(+)/H(+) antiporter NhaP2 [Burkholderiales bacterium]|nr:MAG: K(+)/H(+) antiporter NhaP2 [Burkholderiales bacterium]
MASGAGARRVSANPPLHLRMDAVNQLILFGGLLALAAIVLTAAASRSGAPLLLVFLGVGMLAGEDGIGGVRFDDFELSFFVGNLALAVILFDGGLRTRYESFRAGLWPAVSLATVGVAVTAGVTGFLAARLLDLPLLEGLLIGAIVGSTDAAAVFALLHTRGMQLKQRVAATLEIESGSNDPMAVFLTVVLIELLLAGKTTLDATVLASFVQQMGLGAVLGIAAGHALAWLIDRLTLVAAGLYPLLALSGGLLAFGLTGLLGGSGFLAVYLAGLTLGNRRPRGELYILRVHDGLAWLAQIGMFLLLGLLATPTRLLEVAVPGLVVALALMLVARPVAVLLSLAPFRFPWREQAFIAWVGLRGAVPIVLAVFPLFAGLENAYLYFNVAFFVVLVSLVVQGWTIAPLARLLGLEAPPLSEPVQRLEIDYPERSGFEVVGYRLAEESAAVGLSLQDLPLPATARLVSVVRQGQTLPPTADQVLRPGDAVYVWLRTEDVERVSKIFGPQPPEALTDAQYFGIFVIHPEAELEGLAAVYGFEVPERAKGLTVGEFLARSFSGRPVVGDRVRLGGVELVVKEVNHGEVTQASLVLRRAGSGGAVAE